ncbi:GNAT family N-acetyltransferase [Pseudoalteromonas luteoviolacea]|uniref:GNAT family N-acetyltransferase n=1 Tax=Pseudoalteromonas luteoviolacea TaxID=43657 RepID=UPI001EEE7AE7|nr:GNAT family N-acetyltransferase [Pseudoalteromonas luteoviolacea]MCF6441920.1 GNAT family N-acetyltransferase [Pseudoalteromonas luteoviolacea]
MSNTEEQTQTPLIAVKFIEPEDIHVAASLLFQAYRDDPLLVRILNEPNQSKYDAKLRALVRQELTRFGKSGQPILGIYIDENLVAVACAFASHCEIDKSFGWHWRFTLMMGAGVLQTQQIIEKERAIKGQLRDLGEYYFLSFIAVDPHYQGLGYGHYLLSALDSLVSENDFMSGMAVFVTQGNQVNFFEAHGYQLVKEITFKSVSGDLLFKSRTDDLEKTL